MPARFGKFKENDTREVKELVHEHGQIPQTTLIDPLGLTSASREIG